MKHASRDRHEDEIREDMAARKHELLQEADAEQLVKWGVIAQVVAHGAVIPKGVSPYDHFVKAGMIQLMPSRDLFYQVAFEADPKLLEMDERQALRLLMHRSGGILDPENALSEIRGRKRKDAPDDRGFSDFLEKVKERRQALAAKHKGTLLSPENLKASREILSEFLGICPKDDQLVSILSPGSETYGMVCEYGAGSDSGIRDEIVGRFCEHLVGVRPPTYGDKLNDDQIRGFYANVCVAASKAGIPLKGDG